jgi:hypothetical protein
MSASGQPIGRPLCSLFYFSLVVDFAFFECSKSRRSFDAFLSGTGGNGDPRTDAISFTVLLAIETVLIILPPFHGHCCTFTEENAIYI